MVGTVSEADSIKINPFKTELASKEQFEMVIG